MFGLESRVTLGALVLLAGACGSVAPNNPYDPQAPRTMQARGTVAFEVQVVDAASRARLIISGLEVELVDADGQALSGSDGVPVRARPTFLEDTLAVFQFNDVLSGQWRLRVGGLPTRFAPVPPTTFVLAAGQSKELERLRLVPYDPRLAITVVEGLDGTLSTSRVTLRVDESNAPRQPDGQVQLPAEVQVGLKPLSALAPRRPYAASLDVSFEAAHGQNVTLVARFIDASGRTAETETDAFSMNLSASISGRAALEGVPALVSDHSGTRVRLYAPGADVPVSAPLESTETDAEGHYVLGPVPEGAGYRIVFNRDGYESQEMSVPTIAAGYEMRLQPVALRLEKGALSGVFRFEDQAGGQGQHGGITVIASLTGGRRYSTSAVTDASGAWRMVDLPATSLNEQWRVEGQASGYKRTVAGSVALAAGQESVLNPDATGGANPVFLMKISGGFDLCELTGPCVPLAATNQTTVRVSLHASREVTRYRLKARVPFGATDAEPEWIEYDDSKSISVDLSGDDGVVDVYLQLETADVAGPVVSVPIIVDLTPPAVSLFKVNANAGNFTSTQANVVELVALGADETQVGCNGQAQGQPWMAYSGSFICVFDPAPGAKRVCANLRDRAGNTTHACTDEVFLDNVAPSAPVVSARSTTTPEPTFSMPLGVESLDAPVAGASPSKAFAYQLRGGSQYPDWTDCGTSLEPLSWPRSASCAGPPFHFELVPNSENRLQVRARDRAGNLSSENTVTVVHDDTPPGPIREKSRGDVVAGWTGRSVEGGEGYITLSWQPPDDLDVAGYRVYYGYFSSNDKAAFNGTFANEGSSPIDVGKPCAPRGRENDCSFRLTGLARATEVWVNVTSYDQAMPVPNESLFPNSGRSVVPGKTVARVEGNLTPQQLGYPHLSMHGLALRDGIAYVATAGAGDTGRLHAIDVSDPLDIKVLGASEAVLEQANDVYLQGPYAYVADGAGGLQTFSLEDAWAPAALPRNNAPVPGWRTIRVVGQMDTIVAIGEFCSPPQGCNGEARFYSIAPGKCDGTSGPDSPCLVGTFNDFARQRRFTDAVMQGDLLFLAVGPASPLMVVDASDPSNPIALTDFGASIHPSKLAVSGGVLYGHGLKSLLAVDLTTLSTTRTEFVEAKAGTSGASKQIVPYGGYLYSLSDDDVEIFSNEVDGEGPRLKREGVLRLPFARNISNSQLAGARLEIDGIHGYVTRGANGLSILSFSRIRSMGPVGTHRPAPGMTRGDGLVSGHLWVATNSSLGVNAVHVNSRNPEVFSQGSARADRVARIGDLILTTGASAYSGRLRGARLTHRGFEELFGTNGATQSVAFDVVGSWPYAYVTSAANPSGRRMADTLRTVRLRPPYWAQVAQQSFPMTPSLLTARPTGDMAIVGRHLYVANGRHDTNGRVEVFSLENPQSPEWVGVIDAGHPLSLIAHGQRLYTCNQKAVRLLDLSEGPLSAREITRLSMPDTFGSCAASGNVFFWGSPSGVFAYDMSVPTEPVLMARHTEASNALSVLPVGNMMMVLNKGYDAQFVELR